MITLRRTKERHHDPRRQQKVWQTFYPRGLVDPSTADPLAADPLASGFGPLEIFEESRLPPGGGVPRNLHHDAEIITYVREGALACDDSTGHSGVVHAGEFRRLTTGHGLHHRETNASRIHWTHVFQIWLRPQQAGLEPSYEQKRFSVAERRGVLSLIASPDARGESLRIHQDAFLFSAVLERGRHLAHELLPGRRAWLHLVHGEAALGDVVLTSGDGAGITAERAVSLTAEEKTEILLLDLGE